MPKKPSSNELLELNARKPARTMATIPSRVHQALQNGWIESKNLVEWLSVDRGKLLEVVAAENDVEWNKQAYCERASQEKKLSALKQSKIVGALLCDKLKPGDRNYTLLSTHPSDIVRECTAFVIGRKTDLPFKRKLAWIKLHADDPNPGVREVAWFALRDQVIAELDLAIDCLIPFTGSRSERLRRYASEITRPCGVWAAHIPALKNDPQLGLKLLEPLRSDSSKYVRDSVANWLNDASKTQPTWVQAVVDRWLVESPTRETKAIVKRGCRSIRATS
jgi:3-methyladenine DNA glycosylase AlkC